MPSLDAHDPGKSAAGDAPAQASAALACPDGLALLAASPVPSFLSEASAPDGAIAYANPALLSLTGLTRHALAERGIAGLLAPQGDRAEWERFRAGASAGEARAATLLFLRADGSSFRGALTLAPVTGAQGLRLGHILDVTRLKDLEGALVLSQQREALGLLTNSVAHEFNNFLQILIGYVDGLKRRFGDRPEPFFQRAVTRSTEAAERAATLTRQLLTHSRRILPEVRPVDLAGFLAEVVERLEPGLPAGITLSVAPTPGLAPALCDPTQVELALARILDNACEAMDGSGTVTMTTFAIDPGDRTLQRPADGAVGIAVRDHGHGMAPEMQARALAPFATSREAGRGVGLAIAHGLMKRQNGTISLESRPDEGTIVRLVFPAAPSAKD